VTCEATRHNNKEIVCTVEYVSSDDATFTRATLSRGGRTYARGRASVRRGRSAVRMVRVRKLVPGRYRLALLSRNRADRKHLEVRTITVR
jgi:hypothetical protein